MQINYNLIDRRIHLVLDEVELLHIAEALGDFALRNSEVNEELEQCIAVQSKEMSDQISTFYEENEEMICG